MHAGWPAMMGLVACVLGLLMLVASWSIEHTAIQISAASAEAKSTFIPTSQRLDYTARPVDLALSVTAPDESRYFSDLSRLFGIAKSLGLAIGTIEYRSEKPYAALPIIVHSLDFRISDEYPKVKRFIATILAEMSHVALQEIRIDRQDVGATQVQMLLKLTFVYRDEAEKNKPLVLNK